jgi:hypothetical protein
VAISPGQRARVTLASRVATGPLKGDVVSVSPDTLVVAREEGGERRLSRTQVERVDVSMARERDPVRAAKYGILAGAPLLVLAILVAPIASGESGTSAFGIVLIPVAGLAALGAAIGSGAQDVWVEAAWPGTDTPAPTDSLGVEDH